MDLPLFFTLPLIGGFAFVTGVSWLRWRSARQDSQRLYYRAAVCGVALAAACALAHWLLTMWPAYRRGFEWLHAVFLRDLLATKDPLPETSEVIRAQVALVCVYALALGLAAPPLSRWLLRITAGGASDWRIRGNLSAITDPLESCCPNRC